MREKFEKALTQLFRKYCISKNNGNWLPLAPGEFDDFQEDVLKAFDKVTAQPTPAAGAAPINIADHEMNRLAKEICEEGFGLPPAAPAGADSLREAASPIPDSAEWWREVAEKLAFKVSIKHRLLPSDVRGALIQVYGKKADCSRDKELAEVLTLALRNRVKIDERALASQPQQGKETKVP